MKLAHSVLLTIRVTVPRASHNASGFFSRPWRVGLLSFANLQHFDRVQIGTTKQVDITLLTPLMSVHTGSLVKDRLSMMTVSPGRMVGTETIICKEGFLIGRRTRPARRCHHISRPPMKVDVFQWPWGVLSINRVPRGDRPRSRTMFVFLEVVDEDQLSRIERGLAFRHACAPARHRRVPVPPHGRSFQRQVQLSQGLPAAIRWRSLSVPR